MAMSFERSEPHFTAIIHTHNASNSENFAKFGRVLSEITGLKPVVKTGSSFGSKGYPWSLKMVPFDRTHTTSYSASKVTICLSRDVSEI